MNTIPHTRLTKLLTLILLLSVPGLLQAAVTVQLERSTIYSGDTVTLHVTTSDDDQGEKPDLTPLQKDFDILGSSSSRQIQIINGRRSSKHEWLFELAPLHEGTLTIPPLTVGNSSTDTLTLQVNKQPVAATAQAGQAVFIRSEINPVETDTYVQQQILYTIRLYYRIPLIEGDFSDPRIDNAVLERLSEDTQYKSTIDGQNYQVVERRYAIFPERSGELTIGATTFTGRTVSKTGQRSRFSRMDSMVERMLSQSGFNNGFFTGTPFGNPGKRIRLSSDAMTLDIKPRPDSYNGANWLPTRKLVLRDSWAEAPPVIRVGEPVTRTLILEAHGLEASQLPDIRPAATSHLKIYPEQAKLSNRTDGDWIYGRSEQRFTYVASQAGKLELPEIRIDWWDSVNHKPQTTVLPAWSVRVEPSSDQPAEAVTAITNTDKTVKPEQAQAINRTIPLRWQIGAALGVLIILAAVLWTRRSSSTDIPLAVPGKSLRRAARTRRALQQACAKSNTQAAADALLDWAVMTWPQQPPRSLGSLAERVNQGAGIIRELENALYGSGDRNWTGQALWEAFVDGLQVKTTTPAGWQKPISAPSLYPDWNSTKSIP